MSMQITPRTRARIELIGFSILVLSIWLLVPLTGPA